MQLKTVRSADLKDRRVLTRVDFNVPLNNGEVVDDTRIRAALPTIALLLKSGAQVVLCSHLGRPKGQVVDELRLAPVAARLSELLASENLLACSVAAADDCIGEKVRGMVAGADPGRIILLENLRFHPGEEQNDPQFAAQLAALADVYVNDAFGTVHRAHASTEGVAHYLPAYAGLLVEREVSALAKITLDPEKPLTIVIGGAKIKGKIEVLTNLLPKANTVLIGGAMANTFLFATGMHIGCSVAEEEMAGIARQMLELAKQHGTELLLPVDCVVTDDLHHPTGVSTVAATAIGTNDIIVDIGERTCKRYREEINRSRTVFWNGPMGVFEVEEFSLGTLSIAAALAAVQSTAHTVVGGGESVTAVNNAGLAGRIHHVSTGGGAALEFISGRELPGLKVLMND